MPEIRSHILSPMVADKIDHYIVFVMTDVPTSKFEEVYDPGDNWEWSNFGVQTVVRIPTMAEVLLFYMKHDDLTLITVYHLQFRDGEKIIQEHGDKLINRVKDDDARKMSTV